MSGPPPKDPRIRQRQNRVAGAAKLPAEGSSKPAPLLPERKCCDAAECKVCGGSGVYPWHPETLDYWRAVWASPMAAEYLPADVPALVMLFKLIDRFNYGGEYGLAAEIRLQRVCFGLTSIDRRRLQWEVEKVTQAQRGRVPVPGAKPKRPGGHPLRFLRAVK